LGCGVEVKTSPPHQRGEVLDGKDGVGWTERRGFNSREKTGESLGTRRRGWNR